MAAGADPAVPDGGDEAAGAGGGGALDPRALLREAAHALAARAGGYDEAALEAEVLLAHAVGVPRAALLARRPVAADAAARFRELVDERVAGARPVAYLVGRKDFRDLELSVDERVLVPRPETEGLVDEVHRLVATGRLPDGALVDVGTGSGALALALARELPGRPVLACERSARALEVARSNAVRWRTATTRLLLVQADMLSALAHARVAAVVANPPYVTPEQHGALSDDVARHEPREALVPAGGSVTEHLAELARQAAAALRPGGWLLVEVGAGQAPAFVERLAGLSFVEVGCRRDPAGHERIVVGRRPPG